MERDKMERSEFRRLRKDLAAKSITELIDLLASDDLQTRFVAEMCLRDATST
jgi:hypothetical protein